MKKHEKNDDIVQEKMPLGTKDLNEENLNQRKSFVQFNS